jgi:hypothetical protein
MLREKSGKRRATKSPSGNLKASLLLTQTRVRIPLQRLKLCNSPIQGQRQILLSPRCRCLASPWRLPVPPPGAGGFLLPPTPSSGSARPQIDTAYRGLPFDRGFFPLTLIAARSANRSYSAARSVIRMAASEPPILAASDRICAAR